MEKFASLGTYKMNGQYEMIYDAIYLSVLNISSTAPFKLDELTWAPSAGLVAESIPPLADFVIGWRPDAKRVVIVFSDEQGQSFMIPKAIASGTWNSNIDGINQEVLLQALAGATNTVIYTFSTPQTKIALGTSGNPSGWAILSTETSGEWFKLSFNPTETYADLMKIIDKEVCGK